MSDLTATWVALAAQAEAEVVAALAAYEAAAATRTQFIDQAATATYAANLAATTAADVAVTAWGTAALGVTIGALGLIPPRGEQDRLLRAFETATEDPTTTPERSALVARSEPVERGRRAYLHALAERGVEQWERVAAATACEKCSPRNGEVRSIADPLDDHPGCRCAASPVTGSSWKERQLARYIEQKPTTDRTWTTRTGQVRLTAGLSIR